MKDLKNIEDLFKESFNDFEITPPDSVKASVDSAIIKKNRGIWWLPVLAILLAIIPLAYYFTSNSNTEKKNNENPISTNGSSKNETTATENSNGNSTVRTFASKGENSDTGNELKSNSLSHSQTENKAQKELKSRNIPAKKTAPSIPSKTKSDPSKATKKTKKQSTGSTHSKPSAKNPKKTPNSSMMIDQSSHSTQYPKSDPKIASSGNLNTSNDHTGITENADNRTAPLSDGNSNLSDSVTNRNTLSQNTKPDDSSNNPNTQGIPNTGKPKPTNSAKNWYASVYVEPQFDIVKTDNKVVSMLDTKPSLRYSAEVNRTLVSGFGVTSGLGYFKTQDTYSRFTYLIDSVYIGIDSIPIYDQQNPDSIIGYNYIDEFVADSTKETHQFNYSISSIIVPLYVTKQLNFGNNWGMLINAGVVYRMSKVIGDPVAPYSNEPKINKNSFLLSGRVHASYQLNNWMFSLGLNAGYYVKPPVEYPDINTTRFFFNPELGIHFKF